MKLYLVFLVLGLVLLVWSADKFVDGASHVARHYQVPPLLIGMLIIGFGTSAPEIFVSALSSFQGNPGLALGNAYGSNIANIALVLGATALLMPISVNSQVLKKELPILLIVSLVSIVILVDLHLSRLDAMWLLLIFAGLLGWTIREGLKSNGDALAEEMGVELSRQLLPIKKSYWFLFGGLILLILSSRMLVYGAVGIASALAVPDVVIGLTIVAVGTSLPELASSLIAARRGEPDIALGNVLGSNLFNTLAVVGIAGVIQPMNIDSEILYRDVAVMTALTLSLFVFGFGLKGGRRINRIEGGILLGSYTLYTHYLILGLR